jgi:hypothetical protein
MRNTLPPLTSLVLSSLGFAAALHTKYQIAPLILSTVLILSFLPGQEPRTPMGSTPVKRASVHAICIFVLFALIDLGAYRGSADSSFYIIAESIVRDYLRIDSFSSSSLETALKSISYIDGGAHSSIIFALDSAGTILLYYILCAWFVTNQMKDKLISEFTNTNVIRRYGHITQRYARILLMTTCTGCYFITIYLPLRGFQHYTVYSVFYLFQLALIALAYTPCTHISETGSSRDLSLHN